MRQKHRENNEWEGLMDGWETFQGRLNDRSLRIAILEGKETNIRGYA